MTLLSIDNGKATVAHVGDSRAYLLRDGMLSQLTEDHTVANEYVTQGRISEEEADSHPLRHMVTRTLGLTRFVDIDEVELDLASGDRILLCSDGLTEMVKEVRLTEIVGTGEPDEVVWTLVEAANAAGGVDNITVVVVDVHD